MDEEAWRNFVHAITNLNSSSKAGAMDFLFRGEDPDEKVDEVFGRNPTFDPADYEDELPGAQV